MKKVGACLRDGKPYLELRVGKAKYYCSQIESLKEGALCRDIFVRYRHQLKIGGKRKALQLNFPEFASLELDDLTKDFAQGNREAVMAAVLRQARAAAAAAAMPVQDHATRRPKLQKLSGQDDCSRRVEKSSSLMKDACSPSRGVNDRSDDCEKLMVELNELTSQCQHEYKLKVSEREELELKVKDITVDSGIISRGEPGSDKFHERMARLKQLFSSDGCKFLEEYEQQYMSEDHKCIRLRKELEDHNMKSTSESLMRDGDATTGRRREDEMISLSPVLELPPSGITDEVSDLCAPPTSSPVLEVFSSCSTDEVSDISTPPASTDLAMPSTMESEPVDASALCIEYAIEDVDRFLNSLPGTGCRWEDEEAIYGEVRVDEEFFSQVLDRNNKQEFQDQGSLDWSDALFSSSQS